MGLNQNFIVKPGTAANIARIPTDATGGITKEEGLKRLAANQEKINALQEKLFAEHKQSLLIILQGMDAGGKDGTIKAIGGAMNPQGLRVHSYKAPAGEEAEHDFLWRHHRDAPGKGLVSIFNRSHYEEVLIVRVRGFVPEETWKKRYDQINNFEKTLSENGTHVLKFFLHIGKDEQLKRLGERLDDPSKHWKVAESDFTERQKWDDYAQAYEDALTKCSTPHAPWHIIPADRKWYRNYVISQIVVDYLEGLNMQYPKPAVDPAEMKRKYFPAPKP
jgi:PPK2 family polyphosphate:nucleotide phosphotransferase